MKLLKKITTPLLLKLVIVSISVFMLMCVYNVYKNKTTQEDFSVSSFVNSYNNYKNIRLFLSHYIAINAFHLNSQQVYGVDRNDKNLIFSGASRSLHHGVPYNPGIGREMIYYGGNTHRSIRKPFTLSDMFGTRYWNISKNQYSYSNILINKNLPAHGMITLINNKTFINEGYFANKGFHGLVVKQVKKKNKYGRTLKEEEWVKTITTSKDGRIGDVIESGQISSKKNDEFEIIMNIAPFGSKRSVNDFKTYLIEARQDSDRIYCPFKEQEKNKSQCNYYGHISSFPTSPNDLKITRVFRIYLYKLNKTETSNPGGYRVHSYRIDYYDTSGKFGFINTQLVKDFSRTFEAKSFERWIEKLIENDKFWIPLTRDKPIPYSDDPFEAQQIVLDQKFNKLKGDFQTDIDKINPLLKRAEELESKTAAREEADRVRDERYKQLAIDEANLVESIAKDEMKLTELRDKTKELTDQEEIKKKKLDELNKQLKNIDENINKVKEVITKHAIQ